MNNTLLNKYEKLAYQRGFEEAKEMTAQEIEKERIPTRGGYARPQWANRIAAAIRALEPK